MSSNNNSLILFSGNANKSFAENVSNHLNLELGDATVGRFSDGEVYVVVNSNVRGKDVFVIQPICHPSNDNLMELLVLVDALKRASAGRIIAAIPYFGYSRQDRRPRLARVPISARLVADMLTVSGVNRVLTVDLHSDQIQGFFNIPVDNIYASPVLINHLKSLNENIVIVSPDTGGVSRARVFAKIFNVDIAIIDKRRPRNNEVEVVNIIGDVSNKDCIIVDDIIDTANTLCKAASSLKQSGAKKVIACATHAIFSGASLERINESYLDHVIVTDSIPYLANCDKVTVVSMANLFAQAIIRIHREESITYLLEEY